MNLMIPNSQRQFSPYENVCITEVRNNMQLGGRLLNGFYYDVELYVRKERIFFSISELVTVDRFEDTCKVLGIINFGWAPFSPFSRQIVRATL